MSQEKGFLIFYDWMKPLERLSPKDFKTLLMALIRYQKDGTEIGELSAKALSAADFIVPQIRRRKYLAELGRRGAEARYAGASLPQGGLEGADGEPRGAANGEPMAKDRDRDRDEDKTKTETETESETKTWDGSADARAEKAQEIFLREEPATGGEAERGAFSAVEDGAFAKNSAWESRDGAEREDELPTKRGYGVRGNVYLSTEEYLELSRRIRNVEQYIDGFSEKLYRKGYRYPSHFNAICEWWEKDRLLAEKQEGERSGSEAERDDPWSSFDTDKFFALAVKRSLGEDVEVS
jgi:site-specific DNA-cytosine methylase